MRDLSCIIFSNFLTQHTFFYQHLPIENIVIERKKLNTYKYINTYQLEIRLFTPLYFIIAPEFFSGIPNQYIPVYQSFI